MQGDVQGRGAWIPLASLIAAAALGRAVQISNGNLHPDAILWLTIACLVLLAGVAAPGWSRWDALQRQVLPALAATVIALQLGQLLTTMPGAYVRLSQAALPAFYWGLVVAAVAAASGAWGPPWTRHAQVAVLVLAFLFLGQWLLEHSPNPWIDVFVFQRDASAALLSGQDPYGMTFPDIYRNPAFYGPGLSVDGRLQFGFPYPPLSLLLALPGYAFGGDPRYGQLAAMALAAVLMAYARRGRWGLLAAAVYLLTPRSLFVLEQAWTEPYLVLLLSAAVFAACRAPRTLPWALGLLVAVKQYLVLAVPLSLLLLAERWGWRPAARLWARAAAVAIAITLPFLLWSPAGFIHSAVTLQLHQPFRPEALSYLAQFALDHGGEQLPAWLSLVAALLAMAVALWRAPRTPSGFAASAALVFVLFFAFNKQAFCNYYFFVIGALCCALGASEQKLPA